MARIAPDIRRTWLFGPGADPKVHDAMFASGADVLILDLEDFTPPTRRDEARGLLASIVEGCRSTGRMAAIRVNHLEREGQIDLAAAMATGPDIVVYPMADSATQMHALDAAMAHLESALGIEPGSIEILPCCETALGVVDVRAIAAGSPRIRCALLGAEDLANNICAERSPEAFELDHARRRFILECRAANVEPIDAPYTYSDIDGAIRETRASRRLGYRSKALVRPDHAQPLNNALSPSLEELRRARAIVENFDAAHARGEDRALVDGLWVEVPTYRSAMRLIERARRLSDTA